MSTLNTWANYVKDLVERSYDLKGISCQFYNEEIFFGQELDDLNLDEIYPGMKGKMSSLKKAYFNKESLDRAKFRMVNKIGNSYSISLQNEEKGYTNQDHCMVSMIIFKNSKKYDVIVIHRATEICRKFLFDLKFIKEEILPYLGIEHYTLRFIFCRVTLSFVTFQTLPMMINIIPEKVIWENISEEGKRFLKLYLQYLNKMLNIKERGSILKSHWRHFQTFKNHPIFPEVINWLEGVTNERTNRFSNKDTSKS